MDDRTESVAGADINRHQATPAEPEVKTREIRQEISDTQRDLAETIGAIQEKLSPSNMVSDAKDRLKEATTERIKDMANSAGRTAEQVMDAGRQNWAPVALIGIGAAWLFMTRNGSGRGRGYIDYDDRERYDTRTRSARYPPVSGRRGQPGYGETRGYLSSEGQDTEGALEGLSEKAGELTERAGEMADYARNTVRDTTTRAQNQLERMLRENPLMIGAAAVVAGAALGMALPETDRENEWMGETKEQLTDRAQEMARTAVEKAKDVAGDAVDSVTGSGTV